MRCEIATKYFMPLIAFGKGRIALWDWKSGRTAADAMATCPRE